MDQSMKNILSITTVKEPQIDPGIFTNTSWIQLFYGAWVNMAQLAVGLAFGFASVQIPHLSQSASEIEITRGDASWLVNAAPLIVPIGCIISGILMDWAGCRIMLIFCQVPMFVGWLGTALAGTSDGIIIARAITGLGCGMAMAPSRAYGIEIALPNMRGVIGAFPNLAVAVGITLTTGLENYVPWHYMCYICCGLTFVNFCSFIWLPETPYFLLQTKTESETRANLALFRGQHYNLEKEMAELVDFKQENNLRKLSLLGSLGMLFSYASCKPFTLMMIYNLIAQAAGVSIIYFWAIDLLQQTNSSFDLQLGYVLLGVTRIIISLFTAVLLYIYGRRPLALISAMGVTIVCCAFGLTVMYKIIPSVAPQIFLMMYVVFANLGYSILPILMAFELYPLQVRGTLGGVTISTTFFITFASTKIKPLMLEDLGVEYTLITFGLFSLLGCIFVFFCLPETTELTLQEIEEYYRELRPTLSSQRRIQTMNQLSAQLSNLKSSATLSTDKRQSAPRNATLAQLEAQKKLAEVLEKELGYQIKRETRRSASIKKDERKDSESKKSADSKKSRIAFIDGENAKKDNESIRSTASTSKSGLKVIYEDRNEVKDEKISDEPPTVVDKKGLKQSDSPKVVDKKDEKERDDERHEKRGEKRDEDTPKDDDQPNSSNKNT